MPRGRTKQALGPGTKPKRPLRDHYSRAKQGTGSCARKKGARIFSAAAAAPGPSRGKSSRHPGKFLFFLPRRFSRLLRCKRRPSPRTQRSKELACSGDSNAAALPMPCPFCPPRLRHLSQARAKRCFLSPPPQLSPLGFPCWLSSSSRLLGTDTRPAREQPAEPSRAVFSGRSRKRPVTSASPPPTSPSVKPLFSPPRASVAQLKPTLDTLQHVPSSSRSLIGSWAFHGVPARFPIGRKALPLFGYTTIHWGWQAVNQRREVPPPFPTQGVKAGDWLPVQSERLKGEARIGRKTKLIFLTRRLHSVSEIPAFELKGGLSNRKSFKLPFGWLPF